MVVESALLASAADAAVKAGASAGTAALFKAATARAERSLRGPAKTAVVRALAALQSYAPFIQETNERVATFKTFADPTKPVSLLDHFVETKFETGKGRPLINQDDLLGRLKRPSRIVISATAGFGKSMVMRYLALAMFEQATGRIPIFLELRNLNRISSPDIVSFIHASYRRVSEVQIEAFKQGLSGGAFVLLLDGFDELNHDLRAQVKDQILTLTRDYPLCSIVVSGRPDERFKSWKAFTILKVAPMAMTQVIELINKLDYERGVRKRFVQKVKTGLYESHQSFMSTPLLAILMLLTFEQNANIPDKMYLFYGEAFKTLFHKHDALKEQYDRARKSGLAVDDFEKVFSVFCLKTYVQERIEFSEKEITSSIQDALKYNGEEVKPDDFLFDIEEAVCLVMKEGSSYFFVHRSFQEYFTAIFLANCAEAVRDEFIDQVSTRYWDNVLPMLFDMASAQIEPTWVAKNLKEYLSEVGPTGKKLTPLEARFEQIRFWRQGGEVHFHGFTSGKFSHFIVTMMRFYPSISVTMPIALSGVESWAKSTWNVLKEQFLLTDAKSSEVEIVSVPIHAIPLDVLDKSRFLEYADLEYAEIVKAQGTLKSQRAAQDAFLSKLFAQSSM